MVKDNIPTFGKFNSIISDNCSQYTSIYWKTKMQELGIKHYFSSLYLPCSNSSERYNREIIKLLGIYSYQNHKQWAEYLNDIQLVLNHARHACMKFTPYEVHFNKPSSNIWKRYVKVDDEAKILNANVIYPQVK